MNKEYFVNPRKYKVKTPWDKSVTHLVRTLGCWNIKEMTSKFYSFNTLVCNESWNIKGGKHILDTVYCYNYRDYYSRSSNSTNFTFSPNGKFHKSYIWSGEVDPK